MNRKILLGISIMVVLIFCLQPVASMTIGSIKPIDQEAISVVQPDVPEEVDMEPSVPSVTADKPEIKEKVLKSFEEKQAENNARFRMMEPYAPIPEFDYMAYAGESTDMSVLSMDPSETNVELMNSYIPEMYRFGLPQPENDGPKTRADGADLELTQMEWETKVNSGWGDWTESTTNPGNQPGVGGFMVGETTKITVTVTNKNPTIPVSGININFSIYDRFGMIPLIKIPTQVGFSIVGPSETVEYDFEVPAAKVLYIIAIIAYDDDPVMSNNGIAWSGMRTIIWTSDFESGGHGGGSGTDKTWTGDTGATNKWHTDTTAENQAQPGHTQSNSYHHGTDGGISADSYSDSEGTDGFIFLTSPKIDMEANDQLPLSDGQEEGGDLPQDYYYLPSVPYWAGLFTGEGEMNAAQPTVFDTDICWYHNLTDDGGTTWKSVQGKHVYSGLYGDWTSPFGLTTNYRWNPNWYIYAADQSGVYLDIGWPIDRFIGDGSGGSSSASHIQNWSDIQFRLEFDGDMEGDTDGLPGFYGDDFITWGYQRWYPPYNIFLSDITNPKSGGQPIIYPNVDFTFETTIENMGEDLTNVPIKLTIKDSSGSTVSGPSPKSVSSLPKDETGSVSWTMKFSSAGAYYITVTAGDLSQDYTPSLNEWEIKVIVTEPSGRVLIVDDDNSAHNSGEMLFRRAAFYKDVETKMMQSLDDLGITYNVFNVAWNESGPTKAIMDNYEAVIWMTGLDNEHSSFGTNPNYGSNWAITLKPDDQSEISSFLNQGDKNIWLISPGVLYDLTNSESAQTPTGFLADYLHLIYADANETEYNSDGDVTKRGTPSVLVGDSDSLGKGASYKTYADKPEAGFGDLGSIIKADPDSQPIFYQNTARTNYNSLQYNENYNLVYFAFSYYLIEDAEDREDLTYRVLNFFGMEGGVDVDLDDTKEKKIDFGQTISFKFKITNLGLMTETMSIKLVTPSPDNIPTGWTIKLNDKSPSSTTNELDVAGGSGVRVFYLNVTAPTTYLDSTEAMDPSYKNTTAGSEIQFKVRVESKNYPDNFYDFGACKVTMGLVGDIKLTADDTEETIDVATEFPEVTDFYVEYDIMLKNVTNGEDDTEVTVTVDNPTELTADVLQGGTKITGDTVTLIPRQDQQVSVRVAADEHEPAGDYDITFKVLDANENELNSTVLTTTMEQYYHIQFEQIEDLNYSRVINPNSVSSDIKTEEFEVRLLNYGNGDDTIELEWDENRDSPNAIPYLWEDTLVEIYDKDGGSDTIDTIMVPAYDKHSGTPGEAIILVKVNIPMDEEEEGQFKIDLVATSGAPRTYENKLQRDYDVEVAETFTIDLVLPELKFDTVKSELRKNGMKITPETSINEGDTIQVYIVISNEDGTAAANDVDVKFTVTLNSIEDNSYETTISVGAGDTTELSWDYATTDYGMFYFKVQIDPNDDLLGDSQQDNSWNQYQSVEEIKDDNGGGGGLNPFDAGDDGGGLSTTALALIVIIVIVIIIVVVVLFFMMQRKKGEDEDIDDITMLGGPMGGMPPGGMPPGGMPPGGMPPGGMPPGGMPPGGAGGAGAGPGPMGPAAAGDVKALSPQARKQLPPAAEDTGKTCGSCGEKNPPENKFCQGCGGKL
jgi:hypothetical protein